MKFHYTSMHVYFYEEHNNKVMSKTLIVTTLQLFTSSIQLASIKQYFFLFYVDSIRVPIVGETTDLTTQP